MLIAMENPVPQSLFTVYVTWHTEDAAAGAAACPVAADAPMTPAATRVPAASEQAAAQTAAERPGDRFINTRIHIPLAGRSEEHTSELQSRENLVCRLLI